MKLIDLTEDQTDLLFLSYADEELLENFFTDNMDLIGPAVKVLFDTAARPLLYKIWKSGSKNAVKAVAAIKAIHDQGSDNPIAEFQRQVDVDIPTIFLKRLLWDLQMYDIPGVAPPHRKPKLLPQGVGVYDYDRRADPHYARIQREDENDEYDMGTEEIAAHISDLLSQMD